MYWKHPEIARRWSKKYKQNLKRLPGKKKAREVLEFAFGQPSHPSPASPLSNKPMAVSLAAKACAAISTPKNERLRAAKMRLMAKVAKKVKRRLVGMGFLKGNS